MPFSRDLGPRPLKLSQDEKYQLQLPYHMAAIKRSLFQPNKIEDRESLSESFLIFYSFLTLHQPGKGQLFSPHETALNEDTKVSQTTHLTNSCVFDASLG